MKFPRFLSVRAVLDTIAGLWLKGINRTALIICAVVLMLTGMGAAHVWKQDTLDNNSEMQTSTQEQTDQDAPDDSAAAGLQVDAPPDDSAQQNATTAGGAPKTSRSLIITPSSFTVKAGENLQLTIKANDGKAINYPHFTTYNDGNFLFNFAAAPAKTTWSGPILVYYDTPVGTYTLDIAAQTESTATYYGTITVNVVEPTMTITIQPQGYDAENDGLGYLIKINRLYGFSEPVTDDGVAAFSATEPGLGCFYIEIDANSIALGCGHDPESGPRPTSGTLSVYISTDTVTSSATISYTLPPLGQ